MAAACSIVRTVLRGRGGPGPRQPYHAGNVPGRRLLRHYRARRAHPSCAAAAAACCAVRFGLGHAFPNVPRRRFAVPVLLLAYSLGTDPDQGPVAALTLVLLVAGVQLGTGADGVAVSTRLSWCRRSARGRSASWSARAVASTEQLAARGRELEAERELFAAEAVRYERARIARELHDIVAHCVSVVVIQASAGQRLTATDPSLAAEAFDAIAEVVRQAESEIGRLVQLLDQDRRPARRRRPSAGRRAGRPGRARPGSPSAAGSPAPPTGCPRRRPTRPTGWSRRASPTR